MRGDEDNFDAPDEPYSGPNRRRSTDEELHRIVEKIGNDIVWFKRIVYACWVVLGLVMYYAVLPATSTVHNEIDANKFIIARHEDRLLNLESSRQRRIDRSRDDHRNCHMKDLP